MHIIRSSNFTSRYYGNDTFVNVHSFKKARYACSSKRFGNSENIFNLCKDEPLAFIEHATNKQIQTCNLSKSIQEIFTKGGTNLESQNANIHNKLKASMFLSRVELKQKRDFCKRQVRLSIRLK